MSLAIFAPNLIGDAVMATPSFRAIRASRNGLPIVLVAKPAVAETLEGLAWFDHVVRFDPRSRDPLLRAGAVVRQLREGSTDSAILFPNSIRSALLATLAGCHRRFGYARGGRGLLLTDRLNPPRDNRGRLSPVPIVEYYARLARCFGCEPDSMRLELATTERDESAADNAVASLGIELGSPLVCLNTGGAFGPAKRWPEASFARLAQRLVDGHDVCVTVICGPDEREAAAHIAALAARPRVTSLASAELSVGLSKAIVKRSSLMVTTDSGPRHFAAAFGVPVVTLFGPTHIAWTRTYHPRAVHLQVPVDCGPCQKRVCPLGHHRCMTELDVETVYRASVRLLAPVPSTSVRAGVA